MSVAIVPTIRVAEATRVLEEIYTKEDPIGAKFALKHADKVRVSVDTRSGQLHEYETFGWGKLVERSRLRFVKFVSRFEFLGKFLLIRYSKMSRNIKRLRASYQALEMMYTYKWKTTEGRNILDRVITHLNQRFFILNCRAVRNRLRLVKKELKRAILSLRKKEITIISLGAGSARAIIEVLAALKAFHYPLRFTVILVDISKNALRYS